LLEKRYQTQDIATREAFENAITMVAVLGGSNPNGNALNS
jgi:dihydroxyacid dehydratase/phosphogluconate dehydratase